jgi:hypothetical protein
VEIKQKRRGKNVGGSDFLIDAAAKKVVISSSSGNYSNLPALQGTWVEKTL